MWSHSNMFEFVNNYNGLSLLLLPLNSNNTHGTAGGRLNKKDGLTRYGDSHVKDKTS